MKLSRTVTAKMNHFIDNYIPPVLRDSKWFMYLPIKLFARDKTKYFLSFKDRILTMKSDEYAHYYSETSGLIKRETDLNSECIKYFCSQKFGKSLLDVGCGSGYLLKQIRTIDSEVLLYGCDMRSPNSDKEYEYKQSMVESLPYKTRSVDTVVSTHVLEHVKSIEETVSELRRVAQKKLIVVVPCERPYKYSLSYHLNYFTYDYQLVFAMAPEGSYTIRKLGGDWVYEEHVVSSE